MGAGQMRDRVLFQRPLETETESGGVSRSFEPLFGGAVWGELVPEKGGERLQSGRLHESAGALLRVRSSDNTRSLTTDDQAVINGTTYNIRSIEDIARRRKTLELVLERGVAV